MRDVQSEKDPRNITLDYVGVQELRLPIRVREKGGAVQNTVGTFSIGVDFPHSYRGTHMSRFVEVLYMHLEEVSESHLKSALVDIRERLQANRSELVVSFAYAIKKKTPVTKLDTIMYVDAYFHGELSADGFTLCTAVTVPVHTLCPCSRDISEFGAHNQRADVTVHWKGSLWIEDVVEIVEASASQPLYPLLKRPDEKFVTERAYLNPRFVEDLVKEVYVRMDPLVPWFKVKVVSYESIHPHNAVAVKERRTP